MTAPVGLEPQLSPNVVNGLPAVQFDGTGHLSGSLGQATADATVLALFRYTIASSNNGYLYTIGSPGQSGGQMTLSRHSVNRAYHFDGAVQNFHGTIADNQFMVSAQTYGGANSRAHVLRIDGTEVMSTQASGDYATDGNVVIGNWSAGASRFVGDLVEVLVYDHALSANDRLLAAGYLRQRAGLGPFFGNGQVDMSTWSVVQYEFNQQPDANWTIAQDGDSVHQPTNADASIFLSDFDARQLQITGTFVATNGPDFIGFVFGYQDRGHYYLFDWKRLTASWCGATRTAGMRVRVVDVQGPGDPTCSEFWDDVDGPSMTTLISNGIPWQLDVTYQYELLFRAGTSTIRISDGGTTIESWTIQDGQYQRGPFGMFLNSQQMTTFTRPTVAALDVVGTKHGQACASLEGIEPELVVSGSLHPGDPMTARIQGALGGSLGVMLLGTQPTALPLGGGCFLNVIPIVVLGPLPLSGSVPGSGFAALGFSAPAQSGAVLQFQAAVLDPLSPLGLVTSRGCEVVFP